MAFIMTDILYLSQLGSSSPALYQDSPGTSLRCNFLAPAILYIYMDDIEYPCYIYFCGSRIMSLSDAMYVLELHVIRHYYLTSALPIAVKPAREQMLFAFINPIRFMF